MMHQIRMYNDNVESTGLFVEVPVDVQTGKLKLILIPEVNGNTFEIKVDEKILFSVHPGEEDISIHMEGDFTYGDDSKIRDDLRVYNTPDGFRWELIEGARLPFEGELHTDDADENTFPSVEFNIVDKR